MTYGVVVDVDNTDGKLMPYMTAKLQFEVARRSDVLLVPDQALRWRPTWEQITPSARAGLTPPGRDKTRPAEETKDEEGEATNRQSTSDRPRSGSVADDGLVRPVPVKIGLSDGMVTEFDRRRAAGQRRGGDQRRPRGQARFRLQLHQQDHEEVIREPAACP